MLTKVMTLGLISVIIAACAGPLTKNKCQTTVVVNRTSRWGTDDERVLQRAQRRCKEIWSDAPCLKTFDKLDENRYTAKCGPKD